MTTQFFKKTTLGFLAIACLPVAAVLVAPTVDAAPPAAVAKAQKVKITVTVPEDSAAVTYQLGGETVTIEPGSSGALPVNATNISLSKGSFLNVIYLKGKKPPLRYEVLNALQLNQFSYAAFLGSADSFVRREGASGEITHPTGEIKALLKEIRRMTQQNPNPTNIVGGDQTDGN